MQQFANPLQTAQMAEAHPRIRQLMQLLRDRRQPQPTQGPAAQPMGNAPDGMGGVAQLAPQPGGDPTMPVAGPQMQPGPVATDPGQPMPVGVSQLAPQPAGDPTMPADLSPQQAVTLANLRRLREMRRGGNGAGLPNVGGAPSVKPMQFGQQQGMSPSMLQRIQYLNQFRG